MIPVACGEGKKGAEYVGYDVVVVEVAVYLRVG